MNFERLALASLFSYALSFLSLDMLTGFCNVALNVGGRSQPARHINARGPLYFVGYGTSVAEQKPIFGQVAAFHAQKRIGNLGGVSAPSHIAAKQAQGEECGVAHQKMRAHVYGVGHGIGRRREIGFKQLEWLGEAPQLAIDVKQCAGGELRFA